MKKTTKKLRIAGETLRRLGDHELANANGGTGNTLYCPPTWRVTQCPPHTPQCPI